MYHCRWRSQVYLSDACYGSINITQHPPITTYSPPGPTPEARRRHTTNNAGHTACMRRVPRPQGVFSYIETRRNADGVTNVIRVHRWRCPACNEISKYAGCHVSDSWASPWAKNAPSLPMSTPVKRESQSIGTRHGTYRGRSNVFVLELSSR